MVLDVDTVVASEADAATWTAGEASRAPEAQALERGASVGRYVILERLGAGGMGVVYAAYDPELDRKVAVKLVRDEERGGSSQGLTRLQREAQAMARLAHPNVISVHDVGSVGDRLFIAMEFVAGQTLSEWLATPRPWTEVLDAFAKAGAGLAAAHAAGLVHRDFKPDNVLVSREGRVQVLDFGLARADADEPDADPGESRERLPTAPDFDSLSSTLTAAGAIMGTPAYMAPEQHLGRRADARADQFAFCVALFEGLFGYRPFAGASYPELALAVLSHERVEAPKATPVPSSVTELGIGGLAREPDERHASMDALLEALQAARAALERRGRPSSGRRAALALTLGLSALGFGLALGRGGDEADVCAEARAGLDETWSRGRRDELGERLSSAGLDGRARAALLDTIDSYADSWSAMSEASCRATRVEATQSDELMDLRGECLARRQTELAAQLEVLEGGESVALAEALASFEALVPVSICADAERLRLRVPAPEDPQLRAEVEADEVRLAHARAQLEAGLFVDALASLDALGQSPSLAAHVPLRAAHAHVRARALAKRGEYDAAESQLRLAALDAAAARDDRLLASILIDDFGLVGAELGRIEEAMLLDHAAQVALARLGGDESLDRKRRFELARTRRLAGEVERGLEILTELAAELDEGTPFATGVTQTLAGLHANLGHYEEATAMLDAAISKMEARLGPEHPGLFAPLLNRAAMYAQRGELERSALAHEHLLPLVERWYGSDHPRTAVVYESLGLMRYHGGEFEAGRELLDRAVAAYAARYDAGQPDLVRARGNLSGVLIELGEHDAAESLLLDSRAQIVERFGPKHDYLIFIDNNLASLYAQTDRLVEGLAAIERGRAVAVEVLGPVSERVIECDLLAGTILRELGRFDEARATLERALASCEQTEISMVWRAQVEAELGAVLIESGAESADGRALIETALGRLRQAGAAGKPLIAKVEALLVE